MTDLERIYHDRVEGVREAYEFDLAALPDDEAGIALMVTSGELSFVVLASRDDSGKVLDIEMRTFYRETDQGATAWTMSAPD